MDRVLHLWVAEGISRRRQWHPTPVLLPGKSHGRRSLVGCSPWGHEESDTTEWLHFHFSLLYIGEGNGNPFQCSCLENLWDGVAQSQTRLKWLSSSSRGHLGMFGKTWLKYSRLSGSTTITVPPYIPITTCVFLGKWRRKRYTVFYSHAVK